MATEQDPTELVTIRHSPRNIGTTAGVEPYELQVTRKAWDRGVYPRSDGFTLVDEEPAAPPAKRPAAPKPAAKKAAAKPAKQQPAQAPPPELEQPDAADLEAAAAEAAAAAAAGTEAPPAPQPAAS